MHFKSLAINNWFSNNVTTLIKNAKSEEQLLQDLSHPNEMHLVTLLAALAKGISYHKLHKLLHVHFSIFAEI